MALAHLPASLSPSPTVSGAQTTRKPGLLVIDDERALLEYLKRVFSTHYEVLTAESVVEAEALLREHGEIKVVLCDEEMPGEKGLEFLSRTRSNAPQIQRILMTGHTDPETFLRAIHEGDVLCFLVKPASPTAIRAAVDRGLAEHAKCATIARLTAELEEANRRLRSVPRIARNLKAIAGAYGTFLTAALKVVFLTTAAAVTLGALGIAILYCLKSFLGIDLFEDRHLSDFMASLSK